MVNKWIDRGAGKCSAKAQFWSKQWPSIAFRTSQKESTVKYNCANACKCSNRAISGDAGRTSKSTVEPIFAFELRIFEFSGSNYWRPVGTIRSQFIDCTQQSIAFDAKSIDVCTIQSAGHDNADHFAAISTRHHQAVFQQEKLKTNLKLCTFRKSSFHFVCILKWITFSQISHFIHLKIKRFLHILMYFVSFFSSFNMKYFNWIFSLFFSLYNFHEELFNKFTTKTNCKNRSLSFICSYSFS